MNTQRDNRLATQQELLRTFVQHYAEWTGKQFAEPEWPDLIPKSHPQCDCIATAADGSVLAIELTELEVLEGKFENDKKFLGYLQSHESKFEFPNFRLEITILGSDLHKDKRIDWKTVPEAIFDFISQDAASLPPGHSKISDNPNVPFSISVYKEETDKPGGLWFKRADSRQNRNTSLSAAFEKALEENKIKFANLDAQSCTRVLLLENKDVQLTHAGLLYAHYLRATNGLIPDEYDEVWLCWTWPERTGPSHNFICFDGPMPLAVKANGMWDVGPHWKQHFLEHIEDVISDQVSWRNL